MINLIEKAFGIYSILLIIISTFGSTFSSCVCYRLGKKGIPTFKILSFVFILEATTQYTWILDIFLQIFFENNNEKSAIDNVNIIESLSIPTCKIFAFNQTPLYLQAHDSAPSTPIHWVALPSITLMIIFIKNKKN